MIDRIFIGDALHILKSLPSISVHTCVTSPPYFGLRDYGVKGQMGLEDSPDSYVQKLVVLFREVRRVLQDDGTLWLNLGDSYSAGGRGGGGKQNTNKGSIGLGAWKVKGYAQKQLLGIPWRVAFALQTDGWLLRSDIIWAKPNVMPESVTDRPTKAHEYLFLFAKSSTYYYDADAIREPLAAASIERVKYGWRSEKANASVKGRTTGIAVEEMGARFANPRGRNKRTVWTVTTSASKMKHMAMFPEKLIEPCILAGAPKNALVLDPFLGSGTTAAVAKRLGRRYVGIELNPAYVKLAIERLSQVQRTLVA